MTLLLKVFTLSCAVPLELLSYNQQQRREVIQMRLEFGPYKKYVAMQYATTGLFTESLVTVFKKQEVLTIHSDEHGVVKLVWWSPFETAKQIEDKNGIHPQEVAKFIADSINECYGVNAVATVA